MSHLVKTEDILRQIQAAVLATLDADNAFADIALVELLPGDITATVEQALAGLLLSKSGKGGLTLLIWPPDITSMQRAGGGVGEPLATIKMELLNSQAVNFGSGGPSLWPSAAAWRIFGEFHNRAFPWLGVRLKTTAKPIEVVQAPDGDVRYSVTLECYMPPVDTTRVATPVPALINQVGSVEIGLTSEPGALIYYTTAPLGTLPPYPSPTAGTRYIGSIVSYTGLTLMAAAYKDGCQPSEVLVCDTPVAPGTGRVTGDGDDYRVTGDGDLRATGE